MNALDHIFSFSFPLFEVRYLRYVVRSVSVLPNGTLAYVNDVLKTFALIF
jgi:hypothetical protein